MLKEGCWLTMLQQLKLIVTETYLFQNINYIYNRKTTTVAVDLQTIKSFCMHNYLHKLKYIYVKECILLVKVKFFI